MVSSGRKKKQSEPIIDYCQKNDEYIAQLEEKASRKMEVEEVKKIKEQVEMQKQLWNAARKAYVALKESKKAFDLQLSAKQYVEMGESVHNTTNNNALECLYRRLVVQSALVLIEQIRDILQS